MGLVVGGDRRYSFGQSIELRCSILRHIQRTLANPLLEPPHSHLMKCCHHRLNFSTLLRQHILNAGRNLGVNRPLNESMFL